MKIKTMRRLNSFSGLSFVLSSLSLVAIPFIKFDSDLPFTAYIVALVFWTGLITGIIIQILLAVKCNKMNLNNNGKKHRVLYLIALAALALFVIFAVFFSKNSFGVVISLLLFLLSLQEALVFKRRECLK